MAQIRSANARRSAHSVRTKDELWSAAKRRADAEGITMNSVIEEILEGYARGLLNLPKVTKTYAGVKRGA